MAVFKFADCYRLINEIQKEYTYNLTCSFVHFLTGAQLWDLEVIQPIRVDRTFKIGILKPLTSN